MPIHASSIRRPQIARAVVVVCALATCAAVTSGCRKKKYVEGPPQPVNHQLGVTGAGQALSRITAEPVDEFMPAIAPDGKALLFDVRIPNVNGAAGYQEMTIVGVDPNTGARRTLYTPTSSFSMMPAWLPDGSSFVYPSNSPGSWSLVKALSTSPNAAITVLVNGDVAPNVQRPTVAPDGKRVAFNADIRGVQNIAVADVDGAHYTILGGGSAPSWSPDGKRLAFSRTVANHEQIFVLDPDTGTNLVQLTTGDTDNITPAWAPNAKYLLFTSNRGWNTRPGGTAAGTKNLFLIKLDGTGLTQITDGDGESTHPCWGRDGWIYFSSNQAGNYDIWRLKPVGEYAVEPLPLMTDKPADKGADKPADKGSDKTAEKDAASKPAVAASKKP